MATWLKQSTATTIVVGPLVDSVTAANEEGLTISSGEVLVWKQGGTSFGAKNDATAATHRSYGMYTVPLDATDTNTLGQFIVGVFESGILTARHDYQIVPANVWDSMFGADLLQVDVKELNSVAASAVNLERSASAIYRGTVTHTPNASTTTTFESSDITTATADYWIGRVVIFTSGAIAGQATSITDYALNGSNGLFTVDALTSGPAAAVTFVIV